jgi:hypothetical protein
MRAGEVDHDGIGFGQKLTVATDRPFDTAQGGNAAFRVDGLPFGRLRGRAGFDDLSGVCRADFFQNNIVNSLAILAP